MTPQVGVYDKADADAAIAAHAADYGLHSKVIRKTADESVQNDTLQPDNELLFAIGASEVWKVTFNLIVNSGTTPDIKFDIVVPSGASGFKGISSHTTNKYTAGPIDTPTVIPTQGIDELIIVEAIIINGTTAGNGILEWAQNVTTATDTTVKANSCLVATKLP